MQSDPSFGRITKNKMSTTGSTNHQFNEQSTANNILQSEDGTSIKVKIVSTPNTAESAAKSLVRAVLKKTQPSQARNGRMSKSRRNQRAVPLVTEQRDICS